MALNQRKRKFSMAFTGNDSASSSSSSSSTPPWKYDAFLSFRGEDTRKTFVDHLFFQLKQKGIDVFKDDEELRAGNEISPALLEAIEESRLAIIVFSENYASSRWCLEELVKIQECKKEKGQKVIPIFYHVEPTEVRHQRGNFAAAFANHERVLGEKSDKVQRWRAALKEAADSVGFDAQIAANGFESQCIQKIVGEILSNLGDKVSCIDKNLVGIEWDVERVISMLRIESIGVRSVGIWGMGGIGKTTLAKVVFDQIRDQFEGSSYLENIRLRDLEFLQEKLFSNLADMNNSNFYKRINIGNNRLRCKKVLVVLDGVDDEDQIDRLVGQGNWFGSGSRFIITTRDKQLLSRLEVDGIYEVKLLKYDEAIQLFSRKAFNSDHPNKGYEELSHRIVNYAGCLPLALIVIGCSLYGRDMAQWRCAVERLKVIPGKEKKILKTLEMSFEGLELPEKDIFLDIACFFRGQRKDHVIRILNSFGFHAEIGINILIEKCLIIDSPDGTIQMHDLIQEMGQHIVCRGHPKEPGKHSRLWRCEDICNVLEKETGSEVIEGIRLDLPYPKDINFSPVAFKKMDNLRLLTVKNANISKGPKYLPNNLRVLNWYGYPSESLPESFEPEKLVKLKMHCSHIVHPWKGIKKLPKLEVADFSLSERLTGIPDFTGAPKLERLILSGCTSLVEVHPSINQLHNLKVMNFSQFKKLTRTPDFTGIPKLEILILSDCTSLEEVHPSISFLTKLNFLDLGSCKNLTSLPSGICKLKSLETLDVSGCSKLDKLPEKLGEMECLQVLHVGGTAVLELPSSIIHLKNLKALNLGGRKGMVLQNFMSLVLPAILSFRLLQSLCLSDSSLLDGAIPNNLGCLHSLELLVLGRNNFCKFTRKH